MLILQYRGDGGEAGGDQDLAFVQVYILYWFGPVPMGLTGNLHPLQYSNAIQNTWVQHSTVQYNYSKYKYSTVQVYYKYSTVQVQYSTVQLKYSTVQVQYTSS